ncbi:hypothetical protein F1559_005174 [Cyanidiococcus yangmingshanensis]|uniref:Uncharacterized protein n=1 Tax=Cyanidiococcus yangmingshanensis TaxID=2690220 RepID=A0A7J7IEI9_9RHOD|nr:hypothetical protein F1559_005174 [Cyanidiococcus yangmingshanensis]
MLLLGIRAPLLPMSQLPAQPRDVPTASYTRQPVSGARPSPTDGVHTRTQTPTHRRKSALIASRPTGRPAGTRVRFGLSFRRGEALGSASHASAGQCIALGARCIRRHTGVHANASAIPIPVAWIGREPQHASGSRQLHLLNGACDREPHACDSSSTTHRDPKEWRPAHEKDRGASALRPGASHGRCAEDRPCPRPLRSRVCDTSP